MSDTLEWSSVKEFFDNPSDPWLKAYGQLSESARRLLLAVLDVGDRRSEDVVRQSYQSRIQDLADPLPWDQVKRQLTGSFLTVTRSYAGTDNLDFQHPTLRDLILLRLQSDPVARRRYISHASPKGLSDLIVGLSGVSRAPTAAERFNLVDTDKELSMTLERIAVIAAQPLMADEWAALLNAALLLIPRTARDVRISEELLTWLPKSTYIIPAREVELSNFSRTPAGQILSAVARAFCNRRVLEANQTYPPQIWSRLVGKLYRLCIYVRPVPYPEYSGDLIRRALDEYFPIAIELVNTIARAEPLVVQQTVPNDVRNRWYNVLEHKLDVLAADGEQLQTDLLYESDEDLHSRFTEWSDHAELIISLEGFFTWDLREPPASLAKVHYLFNTLYVSDPRSETDEDDQAGDVRHHFDIRLMFADL